MRRNEVGECYGGKISIASSSGLEMFLWGGKRRGLFQCQRLGENKIENKTSEK